MSEETENPPLLQGTETVPDLLQIEQLIHARVDEVKNLENILSQQSGTKLLFQRLPKHMRRRAMSHNVKRLPRTVRQAHLSQMQKSGNIIKPKRPSRKFRRRPKNLLQDYNRRQRINVWLETHIWHAKRFHMTNRWGYRLAKAPCDKAFRACYRASAKHCLLQDISYYNCLELSGPEDFLINQFKLITNTNVGLSINARAFNTGSREGSVIIYHTYNYPFSAVGQVNFMWKPSQDQDTFRTLWFWIHPAFVVEILNIFIVLFTLRELKSNDENTVYSNQNGTKLTNLKQSLNRFRLTGPLSHSIIRTALKLASKNNTSNWLEDYFQSESNQKCFNEQTTLWNSLQNINSAAELSPNVVFNFVISDPRYNLPSKRKKARDICGGEVSEICGMKLNAIWSKDIRDKVSKNKLSTAEFIKQRQNNIIPTEDVPLDAAAIPIMLVQQPGNRNDHLGYCSGWDIIIPSNWARPVWLSLIMRGARVGGLRESQMLHLEQGLLDNFYPDTKSGRLDEARICSQYQDIFFRRPPNKRVNFIKLGISSPFSFPWKTLIQEWKENTNIVEQFFVLRDRKKLAALQEMLLSKNKVDLNISSSSFEENCLIPVRINLLRKGRVRKFSIICLAEENDLKNKTEPEEPIHIDENQVRRKDLRNAHLKLLKQLRRKRIKAKESNKKIPPNVELIAEQAAKMRSLWLPEPETIRYSCTRQVFGFVTNGEFSFTEAKGKCVGYITLNALKKLYSQKTKNLVLVRDTSARQYRFANIDVICS